jgi:hypothetical protein
MNKYTRTLRSVWGEILILLFIAEDIGGIPIKVISVSDSSSTANKSCSCVGSTYMFVQSYGQIHPCIVRAGKVPAKSWSDTSLHVHS